MLHIRSISPAEFSRTSTADTLVPTPPSDPPIKKAKGSPPLPKPTAAKSGVKRELFPGDTPTRPTSKAALGNAKPTAPHIKKEWTPPDPSTRRVPELTPLVDPSTPLYHATEHGPKPASRVGATTTPAVTHPAKATAAVIAPSVAPVPPVPTPKQPNLPSPPPRPVAPIAPPPPKAPSKKECETPAKAAPATPTPERTPTSAMPRPSSKAPAAAPVPSVLPAATPASAPASRPEATALAPAAAEPTHGDSDLPNYERKLLAELEGKEDEDIQKLIKRARVHPRFKAYMEHMNNEYGLTEDEWCDYEPLEELVGFYVWMKENDLKAVATPQHKPAPAVPKTAPADTGAIVPTPHTMFFPAQVATAAAEKTTPAAAKAPPVTAEPAPAPQTTASPADRVFVALEGAEAGHGYLHNAIVQIVHHIQSLVACIHIHISYTVYVHMMAWYGCRTLQKKLQFSLNRQ